MFRRKLTSLLICFSALPSSFLFFPPLSFMLFAFFAVPRRLFVFRVWLHISRCLPRLSADGSQLAVGGLIFFLKPFNTLSLFAEQPSVWRFQCLVCFYFILRLSQLLSFVLHLHPIISVGNSDITFLANGKLELWHGQKQKSRVQNTHFSFRKRPGDRHKMNGLTGDSQTGTDSCRVSRGWPSGTCRQSRVPIEC